MGVCPVLRAPPLQQSWQTFILVLWYSLLSHLPDIPVVISLYLWHLHASLPCSCCLPIALTFSCHSLFLLYPLATAGRDKPQWLQVGLLGAVSVLGNVISSVCQSERFCKKGSAEQFSSAICLSPRGHGRSGVSLELKLSEVILMQGINWQNLVHTVGNVENALRMEELEIIQCEGEWKESTGTRGIGRFL